MGDSIPFGQVRDLLEHNSPTTTLSAASFLNKVQDVGKQINKLKATLAKQ